MNELTLNENKMKLSGSANLPHQLINGKSYALTISEAEVRGVSEDPNDNGTFDRTFKMRISEKSEINIISEKEIIKATPKKGSKSQAWRFLVSQEDDYEKFMDKMLAHSQTIIEFIRNL